MDLLSSTDFWTMVMVVVVAVGLHFTAKADRHRQHQETERRREAGEKRLAASIAGVKQELTDSEDADPTGVRFLISLFGEHMSSPFGPAQRRLGLSGGLQFREQQ